ncbi:S-layer homology domain-containing protein [Phormidium sp. FACHB-592]|uniref:S-layer homology domain-containing protein n=1 Tax=Stenomitos frigidus AS-A4 TaxID=2933935 RepID=A0ABV0KHG5_9CYAN|nr:S-layer homology domain-containing protein [Phormidium sp. FACHB-592]MBD2073591.1 S-layer homology domain-containing protein [Phormidium sp. FACHB-592]
MTPSPDPGSDRKRLGADELIAVFVALTSIGGIFFWSISQKDGGMNVPFFQEPTASSPPVATPSAPATTDATPPINGSVDQPVTVAPSLIDPSASRTTPAPQSTPFVAVVPQAPATPSPAPSAAPTTPVAQPKQFTDVPANFWAGAPIAALSAKGILDGFPDGTFRPNKPITRAEFAEIVRRAFNKSASREALKFNDLKPDYWAVPAINQATQTQFMSGFPNGSFQPNRQIPRLQVLLALATGLNLQPKQPAAQVLNQYQDAAEIPAYAADKTAAAIEAGLVLDEDNTKRLSPDKLATRAEVATLVHKALGQ